MNKYYLESVQDLEKLFREYEIFTNAEAHKHYHGITDWDTRDKRWKSFINPNGSDTRKHPEKYPCILIYEEIMHKNSCWDEDRWIYIYEEDFNIKGG